jgi:signal transduction histidine kinase
MTAGLGLPVCLRRFPGAVLHVSAEGTVLASNGRLEAALGVELVGRPFAAALDADSSGAKWARLLAGPDVAGDPVWELVLRGRETLAEPRAFSAVRDPDSATLWLMEHPRDARLDHLRELAEDVNSELANTQRELLRERGRLARALERIERQHERLQATAAALEARQAELERSNRALDEFAHVVSHDLKAPLRSMVNYAAWIEEDAGPALVGDARTHLVQLRAQAGRMRALIDGVLAYARAGRERPEPELVDVGALVREVVETLDPPPGVTISVDEGLPTLRTARVPLRQVLQNLIGNAVAHAGRDDPRVHVSGRPVGEDDAWHEFAVADNGEGIAPELHERIWELFHTLRPESDAAGTGIGLAIVRRTVEGNGGTAWVESAKGAGATFRFLWPSPAHQE